MPIPDGPCKRWSLDFVADTFLSGQRVARELYRLIRLRGTPDTIVSDSGSKLTIPPILEWQNERGVPWHSIAFDKPMQNGFVERFRLAVLRSNGKLIDECLYEDVFENLAHARRILGCWRHDYNHVRRPSFLGGLKPVYSSGRSS